MVSRKTGKDEEWRLSKGTHTGSITVFMSLLLMIIASLLFTLLEGSRYMMLGMTAVLNSQSVTESMFAEYQVPAYQNYHLFMMDSGYGGGELMLSKVNARMQELGQENLNPVVRGFGKYSNFLQMNVTDSSVVRYELATDQNAGPLLAQMSQVMKKKQSQIWRSRRIKRLRVYSSLTARERKRINIWMGRWIRSNRQKKQPKNRLTRLV